MRAVQALAQPADVQRSLFPDFVVVGDELALDFDDGRRSLFADSGASDSPSITADQEHAVAALDDYLDDLSGEHNAEFWLDVDELSLDPRWNAIRGLAAAVLAAFGWPNVVPPRNVPSTSTPTGPCTTTELRWGVG